MSIDSESQDAMWDLHQEAYWTIQRATENWRLLTGNYPARAGEFGPRASRS